MRAARSRRWGVALGLALTAAGCGSDENGTGREVPGSATPIGETREVDWSRTDPLAFLDLLATRPDAPFSVVPLPPAHWIREEHVAALLARIRDPKPAAAVVSPVSSYYPFDEVSTVGREAMFLITGFREERYPPRLCSLRYFDPDPDEIERWWKAR